MSVQKDIDCEMMKTGKLFFQEMSSLKKIVFGRLYLEQKKIKKHIK